MRSMRTGEAAHERALPDHRDDRAEAPYFLGREVPGVRGAGARDADARQSSGGDGAAMRIRHWCVMFLATALLGLAAVWIGDAAAAEHTYRVSWDQNPPEQQVDKYTVDVASSTGNAYTKDSTGNPPETLLKFTIDEPVGTELAFTAVACNPQECSGPSDPVTVTVIPSTPTVPENLQVIRVDVSVEVVQ